jgi:hypothetical protein
MALCPDVWLSLAPFGRLLVCPPRQLQANDAARGSYRTMVLPREPSNVQFASGLSCSQIAGLACLSRKQHFRGFVGQEHGIRCRRVARTRRYLAQCRSLAAPSYSCVSSST